MNKSGSRPKGLRIAGWLSLGLLIAAAGLFLHAGMTLPDVSGLRTKNPKETSLMRLRAAEAKKAGKAYAAMREWVDFDRIPDLLKKAVRVTEDSNFYWHKGIDFQELKESIKRDIKEKRFVRGGSTITQQLAKNLYLSTGKSLLRKLKEYPIARRLEKTLTKDRIFCLYLNVIEFGPGIFGVQAAARHYFSKDVGDLSLEEMVRLTAIIPRPLRTDPRSNDAWMKFKGRWIVDTLKTYKYIGEEEHRMLVLVFE